MRPRSVKMQRVYVERRRIVEQLLRERPGCEIRWSEDCTGRATEVDEIVSRARGGSILNPLNLRTTCRSCHANLTRSPAEAERRGLVPDAEERRARFSWGAA